MIKKLTIKNFQSHKKSEFEFSNGLNIIVGNSDSGKSAIIRAIRWVCRNKPSGNSFRSKWATEKESTIVSLEKDEGRVVRQLYKGKENIYSLFPDGTDNGITFKAFSTSVPEEISKFLNIDDINIQYQLEQHFLLSKSAGEVATHFNKIANLSKIDTATANINSWISRIKSTIDNDKNNIKKFEKQLEGFDYLEKAEIKLEVLEDLEDKKTAILNKQSKLKSKISSYFEIKNEITELESILILEEKVDKLLSLHEKKKEIDFSYQSLSNLINRINNNKKEINEYSILITNESIIEKLLSFYTEKNTITLLWKRLYNLYDTVISNKSLIKESEQKQQEMITLYEEQYPNICPFCGTKLK